MMDSLTAIMVLVVSAISLLVQIYSVGYMKGDPGYAKYFAFMSLFTASMLGLVLARGIIQIYVFWELVGLSSYLLIGFWYTNPAAANAAKKAFLMTRFGDFGLLLGILFLSAQGTEYLDLPVLYAAVHAGLLSVSVLTWVSLGVFAGAVGKSAQFPLHTWLPDAMEGPTPVSALVHSATMVAAGVFLVGRFFPIFEASDTAMNTVALIGGFTALFAATMALVADDIKRVFAFSTVSQLGYMFLALGTGAYVAAFFHLFVHAWFKTLLFMTAGSVNHASGTFDMRYMGGLRKVMPWTYSAVLLGGLSLAGIFPFGGFWSKDEILAATLEAGTTVGVVVFVLGLLAALMTAFYMFRVVFMTFHGHFRGGITAENEANRLPPNHDDSGHGGVHLAESPMAMIFPMAILGLAALVAGFLTNPVVDTGVIDKHAFAVFATENEGLFPLEDDHSAELAAEDEHHFTEAQIEAGAEPEFNFMVAIVSSVLALSGIVIAYVLYRKGPTLSYPSWIDSIIQLLKRRYYMDELYEGLIVKEIFYRRILRYLQWFDYAWIDNVNKRIGLWTGHGSTALSYVQNGQIQMYGAVTTIGVIGILIIFAVLG
jgi:NADH-quinone oxidoreductase subunit L